jgi:hypothetical protein
VYAHSPPHPFSTYSTSSRQAIGPGQPNPLPSQYSPPSSSCSGDMIWYGGDTHFLLIALAIRTESVLETENIYLRLHRCSNNLSTRSPGPHWHSPHERSLRSKHLSRNYWELTSSTARHASPFPSSPQHEQPHQWYDP